MLLATLPQRRELARGLLDSLYRQATPDVEVLALMDNQRRTIGDKRNTLLDIARGEFVTFVDDDDTVTDDYISTLLSALGADVTVFDVSVTLNGGTPFPMRFSKDFGQINHDSWWERLPNHLMATRRELACRARFPDVAVGEDAELALAAEAASRAVDKATGRQFGLVAAPEVRYYTAEWDRIAGRWLVDVDDLQTTVGVIVQLDNDNDGTPESTVTAYQLGPVNALPTGRPWTRIEFLPGAAVKPNGSRYGVHITARWGWTAVPDAIKLATLTQAARFYSRRESPTGPLTSKRVDDVAYQWGAADLDEDVATAVAPYRRLWVAA